MWFGKSIMTKLGLALAMAVPAFAGAPVEPFQFSEVGAGHDAQQAEWDYLMKFKMFGTKGIEFHNESIRVTDSVGWFGTSKGSLKLSDNGKDTIGGPILVGKNVTFHLGPDVFTTGPMYVAGNVNVVASGFKDNASKFAGSVCVGGSADQAFVDKFGSETNRLFTNLNTSTSKTCPDSVPKIKTDLEIPVNKASSYDITMPDRNLAGAGDGSTYETYTIEVPATADGSDKPYDVHIGHIKMENYSKILVKQPYGGRLTRLFIDDLDIETTKGRIVVATEDSVVAGKYNELKNDEYLGTLLIYTNSNLKILSMDKNYAYFQGSIISKGTITIEHHLILAGQVLADSIYIDTDFDGKSFIYVPFGGPEIDPNLLKDGKWIENSRDSLVPIFLDTIPGTNVKFSYCFEVDPNGEPDPKKDASATPRKAVLADFKKTSKSKFPVCALNQSERVLIKEGNLQPTDETKIYINVISDTYDEGEEILVLKIFDLVGAVMPGNKKEGRFNLVITDVRPPHFDDDVKSYNVNENTAKGTEFATIPVDGVEIAATAIDKFKLIVGGTDATLAKTLFDFELVKLENSTDPSLYDSAYVKMTVKTETLNYEALTKTSLKLTFSLENDGKITDASDRTINVLDVNEVPSIDRIYDPKLAATAGAFDTLKIKEKSKLGDTVGFVNAVDPDIYNVIAYGHLAFSVVESGFPFTMKDSVIVVNGALNYETKDSVYTFTVKVDNCELAANGTWTKDCLTTTHKVTVKIVNVPEPPVLECFADDNNCKGPYVAIENSKVDSVIHMFHVADPDIGQLANLVPKIIDKKTNKEATLFYAKISNDTLRVLVKKNIDYETNDEFFNVTFSVTDKDGLDSSIDRRINITDVNETPWVASITDLNQDYVGTHATVFTIYPKENLKKGDSVGVVVAKDPDTKNVAKFGHLEYEILDPNGTVPFEMRHDTIVVKYPDSLNFELANVVKYVFDVKVTNCEWNPSTNKPVANGVCRDTTQAVTVIVQNVPEGPTIECKDTDTPEECKGPYNVKENSALNTVVHEFIVKDPDNGQILTMRDTLTDNNGGKAGDYFDAVMKGDTLKIVVKSNINYETLAKDTIFNVRVTVTDADGKTAYIDRKINIIDVNERPTIAGKDTTITIPENLEKGKEAGRVPAKDPDTVHPSMYGVLTYKIIDENVPFEMKNGTEVIIVTNPDTLDYESLKPDTTFTFRVQVENCPVIGGVKNTTSCLYDTAKVSLSVTDVDEPTTIVPPGDCVGPNCKDVMDSNCVKFCDDPPPSSDTTKILTVSVKENSPTGYKVLNYLVLDQDVGTGHKDTLVASMKVRGKSGADTLFNVGMEKVAGNWRIVVSVKDSSKLDYEKINEFHHVTIYVKDPEDKTAGMGDSLRRIIQVLDVNEAPVAKDTVLKPNENLPKGTVIGKLDVTEPDTKHVKEFGHLEYSIIGKDSTFAFVMDSNKVVVNDPSKMDYELAVHDYTFNVRIANCELTSTGYDGACLYDTAKVTVNIQNLNEPPIIVIDGPDIPDGHDDSDSLCVAFCDTTSRGYRNKDTIFTVGIKENPENPKTGAMDIVSPTGMILFQYHVVDEDTNHATGAKVSWFDAGTTIPSVTTKGSDLFTIAYDSVKHEITVRVKDEKLLDYEALRNASSRNDPDPEYTMGIVVTDPKGMADTLYRKIRITDENEKPLFDVWPLVITENNKINDSLGHVEHPSDIDSLSRNPELYDNAFKMTGGDTALFWLDKDSTDLMRVMIRANVVLDCENGDYICGQDSMYWVYMTYGDTTLKKTYTDLKIPVKLIDLNEPPTILTDTIGVNENSPKGTVVDTIKWKDIDRFDTAVTFKIVNDPIGCFDIDSKTGVVTVSDNKCPGLDFEKNPTIELKVSITDMVGIPDSLYDDNCKCQLISAKDGPITTTKTIKVNIHDVNEPPSITDKTILVKEDTKKGTVIDTVRATDPDNEPKFRDLTYKLIGGDTTTFKIDPKSGALTLIDTLDYEAKSSYYVTVRVDDGEFADTAKVKINIGNIEEWTTVKITEASSDKKTWEDPETIYTNHPVREICWNQDGYDTCMTDLNIAKDSVVVIEWKNPSKDHAGSDTVRIYFSDAIPAVTVTGKPTLVDAENVFTLVEDMGKDTNIYINTLKDSVWVTIKDPAGKRDTAFAIEVSLEPVTVSQGTLDKVSKIADSKLMRDETGKKVTETPVNSDMIKFSYNEIVGQDTVTISYLTDKKGNPVKVAVINDKGKVDSIEVITVTYKTRVGGANGKDVEVSYQADALTGEILVKGPSGELMEQGASKTVFAPTDKDSSKTTSRYTTNEGMFTITTTTRDGLGNDRTISYFVDKKGNMVKNPEGDQGFAVTYTYENKYGNVATESVFIVVDQVLPKVEILSPANKEIIRSNSVKVVWTVDGVIQDTLTLQGLSKGPNPIIRIYRDKAGNEASATVYVYMKDSKDVDISVEQPVTEISREKVDEYYAINPPEKGETFAVSIRNPTTGEEVETLIGGEFKTKEGSGKEPYPGASGSKHLGPTLAMDIKVPVIDAISGLATLDDLITPDGMIALERTNSTKSHKITVEEYVDKYCEDGFKIGSDVSKVNLFDIKLNAKIWVYTSLGNFVDYFSFTQELNDPSFTDDAGLLEMYFEMKPDKDGFVKADNGKQYATGAFVYKVQANIRSKARCTIPDGTYDPDHNKGDGYGETTKRKGDVVKNSDELLKSFGYRRPKHK